MLRSFFTLLMTFAFWSCLCEPVFATANTADILAVNTATTNVTTSAYVSVTSSSGSPVASSHLVIVNNTAEIILIATGASGSEVNLVAVGPTTTTVIILGAIIPIGTRIAVEAEDASATSKFITVSLLP